MRTTPTSWWHCRRRTRHGSRRRPQAMARHRSLMKSMRPSERLPAAVARRRSPRDGRPELGHPGGQLLGIDRTEPTSAAAHTEPAPTRPGSPSGTLPEATRRSTRRRPPVRRTGASGQLGPAAAPAATASVVHSANEGGCCRRRPPEPASQGAARQRPAARPHGPGVGGSGSRSAPTTPGGPPRRGSTPACRANSGTGSPCHRGHSGGARDGSGADERRVVIALVHTGTTRAAHSACVSCRRSPSIGWRGPGAMPARRRPRAPQEVDEDRLGLVVHGVPGATSPAARRGARRARRLELGPGATATRCSRSARESAARRPPPRPQP